MVPEGWSRVELGSLFQISSGGTPSKGRSDFWGGSFPWVSAKDLKRHYIYDAEDHLTELGIQHSNIARPGSILILVRGMTLLKDVPVGLVQRSVSFNQDINALAPREGSDPLFMSFALAGLKSAFMRLVDKDIHGTGRLDTNLLTALPIDVPPLPEQKKIAEILSTWDKAIETTEKLLANAEAQKRALMQQLLTGKRRLPGQTSEWITDELANVLSAIRGGGTPDKGNPSYWNGEIPWMSVKDMKGDVVLNTEDYITETGLQQSATSIVPADTVVIATRMAVGACVLTATRMAINQDLKALFPDKNIMNRYLFYAMKLTGPKLEKLGTGSTVKGVTLHDVRRQTIGFPAEIADQNEITDAIDCAYNEVAALAKQLEFLRNEKRALMQQLLTGKRRVKV